MKKIALFIALVFIGFYLGQAAPLGKFRYVTPIAGYVRMPDGLVEYKTGIGIARDTLLPTPALTVSKRVTSGDQSFFKKYDWRFGWMVRVNQVHIDDWENYAPSNILKVSDGDGS